MSSGRNGAAVSPPIGESTLRVGEIGAQRRQKQGGEESDELFHGLLRGGGRCQGTSVHSCFLFAAFLFGIQSLRKANHARPRTKEWTQRS